MRLNRGPAVLTVLLLTMAAAPHGAGPDAAAGDSSPQGSGVPFDRAGWIALRDAEFAPPKGASTTDVLFAAARLVSDPDPVLRDEVAYGLTVAWIYRERRVPDEAVRRFVRTLAANLGPGPPGDAVLGRSFSALLLSVVAASDAKAPVLDEDTRHALVDAATAFLRAEPDVRGYEARLGWVHATAHAADLLKFLARSARLTAGEQRAIVDAVLARLERGPVFQWGEDERLAAVVLELARRNDFDQAPVAAWIAGLPPAWSALWKAPALDTESYARLTNAKHVLRSLYVSLTSGSAPDAARTLVPSVSEALGHLQ